MQNLLLGFNIPSSLSKSIHSLPTVPLRYSLILLILSKSIPASATLGINHPHTSTSKWWFRSTKQKSLVEMLLALALPGVCRWLFFWALRLYWGNTYTATRPHYFSSWLRMVLFAPMSERLSLNGNTSRTLPNWISNTGISPFPHYN